MFLLVSKKLFELTDEIIKLINSCHVSVTYYIGILILAPTNETELIMI